MSNNWPPDPNKPPMQQPNHAPQQQQYAGKEWQLLEKTLMASIEEQRRARRWGIFFKLLTFGYVIVLLLLMTKGCGSSKSGLETVDMNRPHLAVIDVNGVISSGTDASSDNINEALQQAFENKQAKAVALRINSPGGSPVQSDDIWQTMTQLRKDNPDKKVYAVIEDIGASGAYYIASAADEIWVNPSSLVGSIGVILPSYNVEGLMDKYGVRDNTMTAGEHKDILSMSRPLTEFEKNHVQSVLNDTHKHFINAVKQGRGDRLKNPESNQIFSGLFWSGDQAIKLGLADKTGSISTLEKQLKLENMVNYTPTDPMKEIFGQFANHVGQGMGESFANKLSTDLNNNTGRLE